MYKYFSGLDEAALGPILGPYCCTTVTFAVNNVEELFQTFEDFSVLKIGDSKKLFTSGKSLIELEKTSLAFLFQLNKKTPQNLKELLETLVKDQKIIQELLDLPWYKEAENFSLPFDSNQEEISQSADALVEFMKSKDLQVVQIQSDVVSAKRFNQYLNRGLNKSETCQRIIAPLITKSINEQTRLVVDRQGGRRYYGEWLISLLPGSPLSIERETRDFSTYNIGSNKVMFQVKGDDLYLETALASVISKYTRELLMVCFNNYWINIAPQIKKTAGYPQDGKRFIKDLNKMGIDYNPQTLIRQK